LLTGGYFSTHCATIKTDARSGAMPKIANGAKALLCHLREVVEAKVTK